jgi:hypothetical protein
MTNASKYQFECNSVGLRMPRLDESKFESLESETTELLLLPPLTLLVLL